LLKRVTIDQENVKVYLKFSTKGKEVTCMPMVCKKWARPLYIHAEPECSRRVKISNQLQTIYINTITSNITIKQEAKWAMLEAGIEVNNSTYEKDIDFPKWQKVWSWEQSKREIVYYKEATTRKPINQIMDMTHAIKESDQAEIANRL